MDRQSLRSPYSETVRHDRIVQIVGFIGRGGRRMRIAGLISIRDICGLDLIDDALMIRRIERNQSAVEQYSCS